jgi:hypothetical protein
MTLPLTLQSRAHEQQLAFQRLLANSPQPYWTPYPNIPYGNNALWPINWLNPPQS